MKGLNAAHDVQISGNTSVFLYLTDCSREAFSTLSKNDDYTREVF